jgi:biotin carboxyl carrier protein
MSAEILYLRARTEGEHVLLECPGVGLFTNAARDGMALVAGARAGTLLTLGRAYELRVPDDVAGIVDGDLHERVQSPVGYGSVLYRLRPLAGATESASKNAAGSASSGAPLFRSPSAGRFWHRAAPGEPALVSTGDVIEAGRAIGLVEVMKTFTLVHYQPAGGLPARARVVRVLVADGAEVAEKAPLLELAPE